MYYRYLPVERGYILKLYLKTMIFNRYRRSSVAGTFDKNDIFDRAAERYRSEIYRRTDCSSKKRAYDAGDCFLKEKTGISLEEKRLLQLNLESVSNGTGPWERIDNRLEQRLKQGMVEEVKRLLASGIAEDRFALFGMEYKYVARYVKKQVLYKTMVKELQTSIHQLAKRQETWFRGMERRGIEVHWVRNADFQEAIAVADRCFG